MSPPDGNLSELEAQASKDVAAAGSAQALAEVRASYLGRKGSVAGVLRTIGSLAPEERGRVGKEANEVKARIEALVTARNSMSCCSSAASRSASSTSVSVRNNSFAAKHRHRIYHWVVCA